MMPLQALPRRPWTGTLVLVLLLLIIGTSSLLALTAPQLIKDINPGGDSSPEEFVIIGNTTYFAADDGVSGLELWKTNGTGVGTSRVKDICPGACASSPSELTAMETATGGLLFFVATDGVNGEELWKSDGTASGTTLVKNIRPGGGSPGIASLTAVGTTLFFRAHDGSTGNELWKSDGSSAGTVLVKDIFSGTGSSSPSGLTALGAELIFAAGSDQGESRELWKSNGTSSGTVLVKDIRQGVFSSAPQELTAVGNTVFFSAIYGSIGRELWKTDGTSTGTVLVKDVNLGSGYSFPSELTADGSEIYFLADDGLTGTELWKSDGTFWGTVLVKDMVPGPGTPAASQLTAAAGLLFLVADDGFLGEELWRSDGTAGGTFVVHDINPGAPSSSPSELMGTDEELFFVANDGTTGAELWLSDGSGSGTGLVDDIILGPSGSSPTEPTAGSAMVFFSAVGGAIGRELWALQVGGPALELSKEFAADSVVIGTSGHSFTLTVTNAGNFSAASVRITDAVDNRLTVTSVSPASRCSSSSGQWVDCTFPTLGVGSFETVTVTYAVGPAVAPTLGVVNIAEAGEASGDLVQASAQVDLLAPCEGMPVDLEITDETIDEVSYPAGYSAEACGSISAGPNLHVMGTGAATLKAGELIVLNNGFEVDAGGSLSTILNPLQSPQ